MKKIKQGEVTVTKKVKIGQCEEAAFELSHEDWSEKEDIPIANKHVK